MNNFESWTEGNMENGWGSKPKRSTEPAYNPYVVLALVTWLVVGVMWTIHQKVDEAEARTQNAESSLFQTSEMNEVSEMLTQ